MYRIKNQNRYRKQQEQALDLLAFSKPVGLLYKRKALSLSDMRASTQIERAIMLVESNGLQAKRYDNVVQLSHAADLSKNGDAQYILSEQLEIWFQALAEHTIPAGAILDMVVEGKSMQYVDKRFCKTHGWAREQLIQGLKLWTKFFIEGKD